MKTLYDLLQALDKLRLCDLALSGAIESAREANQFWIASLRLAMT